MIKFLMCRCHLLMDMAYLQSIPMQSTIINFVNL